MLNEYNLGVYDVFYFGDEKKIRIYEEMKVDIRFICWVEEFININFIRWINWIWLVLIECFYWFELMEWLRIGFVDLRYSKKFLEDFIINCLKMFVNDVKVKIEED